MTRTSPPPVTVRSGQVGNAEPAPDPAKKWDTPPITTFLPEELLQGGEVIRLLLKPSPWYILLESMRFLIGVLLGFGVLLWLYNQEYFTALSRRDLTLLAVGVGTIRVFWQFLEWLGRVYVLTDRRIIRVKGVLSVQVFEAPLRQVQHTETTFSLRERFFGLGTIHFATAGTAGLEASWRMIAKPLEVHRIVVETINRYR